MTHLDPLPRPDSALRDLRRLAILAGLVPLVVAGCAGGVEVSKASLEAARRAWEKAGVSNYDLEWVSDGPSRSHYAVEVRAGRVRSVSSVAPDGRRFPLKPAEPRFYGVDGLFLVIADELAQLDLPTPFGRPKGSRAVLRFTPDPTYGYPRRYLRDVVGASSSLTIDVLRFTPVPAGGGDAAPRPPRDPDTIE